MGLVVNVTLYAFVDHSKCSSKVTMHSISVC